MEKERPVALEHLATGDEKYGALVEWQTEAAQLRSMLDEAVAMLHSKQAERALGDDKRSIENELNKVTKQLKQTNPAWWKDGLKYEG